MIAKLNNNFFKNLINRKWQQVRMDGVVYFFKRESLKSKLLWRYIKSPPKELFHLPSKRKPRQVQKCYCGREFHKYGATNTEPGLTCCLLRWWEKYPPTVPTPTHMVVCCLDQADPASFFGLPPTCLATQAQWCLKVGKLGGGGILVLPRKKEKRLSVTYLLSRTCSPEHVALTYKGEKKH